jgi:acyl dehydratase
MAMLQTWAAPRTLAGKRQQPTVHDTVREAARQSGYHGIVATDYDLDQQAALRVGDLVTERSWLAEISELKTTALGTGHFITIAFNTINQHDAEIGSVRARAFYYRPNAPVSPPRSTPQRTVLDRPTQKKITRTMVVAGALSSNDHDPVHHDHETAQRQGLPDIIVSIVTTSGLICAYGHSRWNITQPRHLRLRLAAPVFPGDVLTFSGQAPQETTLCNGIRMQAAHHRGLHCTATVAP